MTETPLSRLRDDLRAAARPGGPDSRPVGHVRVLASDLETALDAIPSPADDDRTIVFDYRNHRGQKARRRVAGPLAVWHGKTKWHPLSQWFLGGHCLDQDAHRDFALADCRFTPESPLTHLRESPSISPGIAIIVLPDGSVFYVGPITQVPSDTIIPHGSTVNVSTHDWERIQKAMKDTAPIATIEH